jgi:hypothetical protein
MKNNNMKSPEIPPVVLQAMRMQAIVIAARTINLKNIILIFYSSIILDPHFEHSLQFFVEKMPTLCLNTPSLSQQLLHIIIPQFVQR